MSTLTDDQTQELFQTALQARRWAYAPYSHYAVGAAVLTASGKIYDGVNIENAAYPAGICAERVAIFKAISEGEREFLAIVVATDQGGSPCGSCRQVMAEFGLETRVIMIDQSGAVIRDMCVSDLLPASFGPGDLIN